VGGLPWVSPPPAPELSSRRWPTAITRCCPCWPARVGSGLVYSFRSLGRLAGCCCARRWRDARPSRARGSLISAAVSDAMTSTIAATFSEAGPLGLKFVWDAGTRSVRVADIVAGSQASRQAGLAAGLVLVSVAGNPVRTVGPTLAFCAANLCP
jgi:hypothetical protein